MSEHLFDLFRLELLADLAPEYLAWPKEGVPGYSSRGIFTDNRNNFCPFIFSKIGINAEDLSIMLRLVPL